MKRYAVIHPIQEKDESHITFIENLQEFLKHPESFAPVTEFLLEKPEEDDPQEWPDYSGLLIEYTIVVPRPKTSIWSIY